MYTSLVFQVSKEESSTGFLKVVGIDPSDPHPAGTHQNFDYILAEYDPQTAAYGKTWKVKREVVESLVERSKV